MYGQIISFLFVLLIIYYAVMIFLDLQKAKAAKAAELEKNSEEEIDISDEADSFKPILITREDPRRAGVSEPPVEESHNTDHLDQVEGASNPEGLDASEEGNEVAPDEANPPFNEDVNFDEADHPEEKEDVLDSDDFYEDEADKQLTPDTEQPFRREGYREASMTGALDIDTLLQEVDQLAETGKGPLGQVIHQCQSAHF